MNDHAFESIDPAVIGGKLAVARKARGLTQQDAATELGVARTTIVAMEKGERRPRAAELVRLAKLYGRQVGDLVRPSPVREPDSFAVQFRAARAPTDSPMNERRENDIRAFQELCERYLALERITESPMPRRYPESYPGEGASPDRIAEEVASTERNRLGLGDGPIGRLRDLLESDVGLRVFAIPFADSRLAGLFAYSEELGGCIAVNANHPEERRRWSAAHEFAHFLTDRYRAEVQVLPMYRRVPEAERFAEAFSRHVLMPGSGLNRRFQSIKRAKAGPITPADVLSLCQLYGVSFQAMVLRLEDLKLLRLGTWDLLHDAGFKADGARKLLDLPPVDNEFERLPYRYQALAVQAYATGDISEGRLAQFLGTDRVGARLRVEELTGSRFDEQGEVRQMALDFGTVLAGATG
ncbi:MAG: ImmA/IrrE family metallo-endopeptidase [Thermomicrobiales bacterium]